MLETVTNRFPNETLKVSLTKPGSDRNGDFVQVFVERLPEGTDKGWTEKNVSLESKENFPKGIIEKPNLQVFNNPIKKHLRKVKNMKEYKAPPPITNQVYYYKLYLNTFIDGNSFRGYLSFNPRQKVRVFYKLKDFSDQPIDIHTLYSDVIFSSELYQDFSFKKRKENKF